MTTDQSEPMYLQHIRGSLICQYLVLNTIPFGIGVAASTRVGNLIGMQSAIGAKRAAHMSALLSVIVGGIVMIVMMASKDVSRL